MSTCAQVSTYNLATQCHVNKASFSRELDLFKSLVVLWVVNTVNELIHLRHIIHQTLSTYPSVLKLFQNLKSILYEL